MVRKEVAKECLPELQGLNRYGLNGDKSLLFGKNEGEGYGRKIDRRTDRGVSEWMVGKEYARSTPLQATDTVNLETLFKRRKSIVVDTNDGISNKLYRDDRIARMPSLQYASLGLE